MTANFSETSYRIASARSSKIVSVIAMVIVALWSTTAVLAQKSGGPDVGSKQPALITSKAKINTLRIPKAFVPTIAPELYYPVWDDAQGSTAVAGGQWQFQFHRVPEAQLYDVCIRPKGAGSGNCWHRKYHSAYGSGVGNKVFLKISIPQNQGGKSAEWLARACNQNKKCGPWSSSAKFTILPRNPKNMSPATGATVKSMNVKFSWSSSPGATSYILVYSGGNDWYYDEYNPSTSSTGGMVVKQTSGTSLSTEIDTSYMWPNSISLLNWSVVACANYQIKGLRCSIGQDIHKLKIDLRR